MPAAEAGADTEAKNEAEAARDVGEGGGAVPVRVRESTRTEVALTPEEEERLDQQRLQGFSETQWFMLAQDPDKLKDAASTEDLYEMQDDYDWDEEISEEERSKFSLRGKKKEKDDS